MIYKSVHFMSTTVFRIFYLLFLQVTSYNQELCQDITAALLVKENRNMPSVEI